jgi:hypothetical protein
VFQFLHCHRQTLDAEVSDIEKPELLIENAISHQFHLWRIAGSAKMSLNRVGVFIQNRFKIFVKLRQK